jgi:uncharacterized protein (DUF58 family)
MAFETRTESLLDAEFLRKLERLAIAVKKSNLGSAKGERRSKRKGMSVEFADYRDYVQGDDLRFIDWNIYGRLNGLYLKLFQEQEDLTLHVLIDGSKSMAFGTPHKFDFARKLAAAVGYVALTGYDRVSIEIFSGEAIQQLRPIRGKASAHKLFSFLQGAQASGGTRLEEACRNYVLRQRGKGVALFISDFFDESGHEGTLKRLLQTGCDVYVLQVLAPEEIKPDLSGDLKLLDSETGGYTEISVSRALLTRYEQNRDAFIEGIRSYCVARGMSHFVVSSDTPLENLTLDILRQGGMLR